MVGRKSHQFSYKVNYLVLKCITNTNCNIHFTLQTSRILRASLHYSYINFKNPTVVQINSHPETQKSFKYFIIQCP